MHGITALVVEISDCGKVELREQAYVIALWRCHLLGNGRKPRIKSKEKEEKTFHN